MPARYRTRAVTMSDATILVSVEDLIYTAFGPGRRTNRVNFKLLHTILHCLARQMRLLEQEVEIRVDEFTRAQESSYDDESETYSSSSAEDKGGAERRGDKKKRRDKQERGEKEERDGKKGKKGGKTSSKDHEGKGRSKDRDDKDKRYTDKHGSPRGRRGEDYGDKGGRERGRGGERGADGREGVGGEREDRDEGGRERGRGRKRRGERGADGREGIGGEREDGDEGGRERGRGRERRGERGADGRGGKGGEREDGDEGGRERGRGGERRGERGVDGRGRDIGRQTSSTSIIGSDERRTRVRPARVGSIEVVTASQFAMLENAVKELEQITGPLPEPVLPDNETLRQDLAMGRASLQDTMQAVQLNARVQAAEEGLYRMAELLTKLAQSGMVPPEILGQMGAIEEYLKFAMAAGHGSAGPVKPGKRRRRGELDTGVEMEFTTSRMDKKKSTAYRMDEKKSTVDAEPQAMAGVTHSDMEDVLDQMKQMLFKEINNLTDRANHSAEKASSTARNVADKMNIAMQVDERITNLLQQTEDYAKQVEGFDSGIKSQMSSFQEQMMIMKADLVEGLALVDASNNNAQTVALLELTERHQELVTELEHTVHLHKNLSITQQQYSDEIKSLMECVEMLREQKADHEEVFDGLRDKADISRVAGMLPQKDFVRARIEIEERISKCYEVFGRQTATWRDVMTDMMNQMKDKAEILKLMLLKDATDTELNDIQKLLHKLEIILGEPKAAILMRKLAKDASCAVCLTPAIMELKDPTHGKPLPLPALRSPPLGAEQKPCFGEVKLAPPDIRVHTCHRWVGGSHTLMSNVAKVKAESMKVQIKPTKVFEGYGFDGKLYMMEEDMQPCAECNQLRTDEAALMSPQPPTSTDARDKASGP